MEAAKAEGKNAQPCYDTASNTLRNIGNTASSGAQRCIDTAESSVKSELSFIDNLISVNSHDYYYRILLGSPLNN